MEEEGKICVPFFRHAFKFVLHPFGDPGSAPEHIELIMLLHQLAEKRRGRQYGEEMLSTQQLFCLASFGIDPFRRVPCFQPPLPLSQGNAA